MPQVVRTIRTRDTHAISLWMYLMFCSGVALWGIYGLLLGSWPIMIANGVTFGLSAVVLYLKAREPVSSRGRSAIKETGRSG